MDVFRGIGGLTEQRPYGGLGLAGPRYLADPGSDVQVSYRSAKDQHSGDDQDLYPSDYSTDCAKCAADRLTRPEDCPPPGWSECLLEALPLVLPDGTPAQQPMRVFPAPFTFPGLRSTRDGSLE